MSPDQHEIIDEKGDIDERSNNVLGAGGVYGALVLAGMAPRVVLDEKGEATNQMDVKFHWMKSPYRITVERVKP